MTETQSRRCEIIARLRADAKKLSVTKDSSPTRGDGTIDRIRDAASGLDHLADLLTHHGHQGGYPNVRVHSDAITPRRYYAPVDRHSWTGSPAAACADGHAYV